MATTDGTTLRHVRWRGEDDPDRLDTAEVELGPDWLLARGDSVTPQYKLTWSLTTTASWVTESLEVQVDGGSWHRELRLRRSTHGLWSAETETSGATADQPAGLIDGPHALDGALDCDLALCPFTNTMPILRHRMHAPDPDSRQELLMAFVDVPSLAVLPSRQGYHQVSAPSGKTPAVVGYESLDSTFHSDLTIDPDGLVFDYPHLARRLN